MGKTNLGIRHWIVFGMLIVGAPASAQTLPSTVGSVQRDPNFPTEISPLNYPIGWSYAAGGNVPAISIKPPLGRNSPADYQGYDDEGSWLINLDNGKVYVWNLKAHALTDRGKYADFSKSFFASLRNPLKEDLAVNGNNKDGPPQTAPTSPKPVGNSRMVPGEATSAGVLNPDPNFPAPGRLAGQRGAQIEWAYPNGSILPNVHLRLNSRPTADVSSYFGYDEEGSWINNPEDGKIYVWNIKSNSLTLRYNNFKEIPKDLYASLRSPQKEYLAVHGNKDGPPQSAPPPPKPVDNSRTLLGNPTRALTAMKDSAIRNAAIPGEGFNGTGAKIQSGMLVFTTTGGSTASYKVVRPKAMAANSQAATEITGSWISMEDGGKAILFTVQTDGSVTGKEMPGAVVQMLMQGGQRP